MKTKFAFLFLALSTLFISCTKDMETLSNKDYSFKVDDFDSVGIVHNQGLDYIYNSLKDSINTFESIEDLLAQTKSKSKEFIKNKGLSAENLTASYSYIDKVCNLKNGSLRKAPLYDDGNIYSNAISDSLTINQKALLDKLNVIMSDEDADLKSLTWRISLLESEAEQTLSEKEQFVIFTATSVSKNTLEYWFNNLEKWENLFDTSSKVKQYKVKKIAQKSEFSWKSVGKNDVAGAVGGAVATGVARFFGPIGWQVWAGAIVGGAAGASAYDATMQLLN